MTRLHTLFAVTLILLTLTLGLLPTPATAQQPSQDEPAPAEEPAPTELQTGFEEMIQVSEVFLDVLVTDRDGNAVRGLELEDFTVEEDGQPVTVTSASYYTTRYGDAGVADDEVPSSRYFLFFFHDKARDGGTYATQLLRQKMRAVLDAEKWVENEMLPSDWAAVVGYGTQLQVQQDFTQDREALSRALRRVSRGKPASDFRPGRREAVGRGRELDVLSRLPAGRELLDATPNVYLGLQKVAEAAGFLVGRKVMFLYTTGFGIRRGAARTTIPDPRYYEALEPVLNDHNIAVYPIDLTPAGRPPLEEDFLTRLAADTGGYYDPNFVGFLRPLVDIASDNVGYYLLTYRTEHPAGEIGYQTLDVRTADPEHRVRTRTGYRFGI
ncbi:MAG: VWA domain-containing protein [Holophagales bacterium]|nr:VWA domain-containing protein [Holophagales bacterium]